MATRAAAAITIANLLPVLQTSIAKSKPSGPRIEQQCQMCLELTLLSEKVKDCEVFVSYLPY